MTTPDDWWTRKYGPDPADVAEERRRFLAENGGRDEDDDAEDARLSRYDERG